MSQKKMRQTATDEQPKSPLCIHTRAHLHAHEHACTHTCMFNYTHMNTHTMCILTCTHMYTHMHLHARLHTCEHMHTCISILNGFINQIAANRLYSKYIA